MRLWWLVNHGLMLGSTVHQYHPIPSLCSTHPCEEKYKTVNNPILTKGWSGSVYNISVTSFVIIQKIYQYELNFWYSCVVSGTPIYLCITYASLFSVFVVTKTLCISAEITLDIYLKIDTLRNLLSCMWPEPKCKLFCQLFCILMMILSENQVFLSDDWIIQKLLTITNALQDFQSQSQKCQFMSPSLFCKQNILIHFAYCYTFRRKFILVWQLF